MPRPSLRLALAVWVVIVAGIGLRLSLSKRVNSVYPIFSEAGRRWSAGGALYITPTYELDQFRYTPAVAAGFAPWGLLSDRAGATLWLGLSSALFLGTIVAWWHDRSTVGLALLLAIPISLGSINNGQCNALLCAMSLLAMMAFRRERWTLAALAVTVAVLFKVYPLSLGLLLAILEPRRFGVRFALILAAGLALPYCLRPADYVNEQYRALTARVNGDDRTLFPVIYGYRDFQMLTRVAGIPLTRAHYQLGELAVAAVFAGIVAFGRLRGWTRERLVWACGALSACWMTVFGPATESSTYIILAPWLAQAAVEAASRPVWRRVVAYASFALFAVSMSMAWFPESVRTPIQSTGIMPLAGMLLSVYLLGECQEAELPDSTVRRMAA
jgi:hypothetical protein